VPSQRAVDDVAVRIEEHEVAIVALDGAAALVNEAMVVTALCRL